MQAHDIGEANGEVRCMLVPLHVGRMIIPNAAVAEVIGYREPQPLDVPVAGVRGIVSWRQRDIPVVDFERFLGGARRPGSVRQRIVICHMPFVDTRWPIIGLLAQGIPRLLRVGQDNIDFALRPLRKDSDVRLRISIYDEEFLVPDLDRLQDHLNAA